MSLRSSAGRSRKPGLVEGAVEVIADGMMERICVCVDLGSCG